MPLPTGLGRTVGLLMLGALALRLSLVPLLNADLTYYVLPWLEAVREEGAAVFGRDLTDYAPAYTYLLWLVSCVPETLLRPVAAVKLISFAGDAAMAGAAFLLVRGLTGGDAARAALGAALVFALPVGIANSAAWGQTDAVWTACLLLAVLAIHRDRPLAAVIGFGLGFAYKPQAAFFGPVLLAFLLARRAAGDCAAGPAGRRRAPDGWGSAAWLALAPLPYLVLALPPVLMGRPWDSVFGVYARQFEERERLSNAAPNLWAWYPHGPEWLVLGGLAFGAAVGAALAWGLVRRRDRLLQGEGLLMAAAFACMVLPFVTPKVHDRYAFAGEVMLVLAAVLRPRLAAAAIAAQVAALLAYQPMLLAFFGWRVRTGSLFELAALILLAAELVREARLADRAAGVLRSVRGLAHHPAWTNEPGGGRRHEPRRRGA